MIVVMQILFTIVIETIFYCFVPILIKIIKKEPVKNSTSIAIINYAICFAILRIIGGNLLGVAPYEIEADLLSLILVPVNIYILRYDKNNPKNIFSSLKENYRKVIKYIVVVIVALLVISLVSFILWKAFVNDTDGNNNKIKNVEEIGLKEIRSQSEFEQIIASGKKIVLFVHTDCVFCQFALQDMVEFAKDYKLTSMYYYNTDNGAFDYKFRLEGSPTMVIYEDGVYVSNKLGYTNNSTELKSLYYRTEIINFLKNNGINFN